MDWDAFERYVDEFGFRRFFDAFDHVGEFILGSRVELNAIEQRLFDSIWSGLSATKEPSSFVGKLSIAQNTLRAGWKYRTFSSISMLRALWIQVKGVLFERRVEL